MFLPDEWNDPFLFLFFNIVILGVSSQQSLQSLPQSFHTHRTFSTHPSILHFGGWWCSNPPSKPLLHLGGWNLNLQIWGAKQIWGWTCRFSYSIFIFMALICTSTFHKIDIIEKIFTISLNRDQYWIFLDKSENLCEFFWGRMEELFEF